MNIGDNPRIKTGPKIYEVDPLTCVKCQGSMRVIAFIEDEDIVKKILNIWACGMNRGNLFH